MSTNLIPAIKPAGGASAPQDSAIDELPVCALSPQSVTRYWVLCGLFAAAGILAMAVDVPLSRAMVAANASPSPGKLREGLRDFLGSMEPFGQPPTIVAVALAVYLCGANLRQAAFRIAGSFVIASLAVLSVKMCISRIRPVALFTQQIDFDGRALDTFQGIFRGTRGGTAYQSFPSGHTTAAVAFCLALAAIVPRGRWLFAPLAGLVALQRIECGAHFLSDTLFAASLACVVHVAVFDNGPLSRWFSRLESK